jgi:hypothetical protein
MNDDELLTRMRKPYGGVRMTTPLDTVVDHGRTLRRGRRLRGLTGAAALAGGIAVVTTLLVPGTARPAQTGKATLAAWTVAKDPDGGITITFNQMKNLAGMQATLRADGVPARVTFNSADELTDPLPRGCTRPNISYQEGAGLQAKILTPPAIYAYLHQRRAEHPTQYRWIEIPARSGNRHAGEFTMKIGGEVMNLTPGTHARRVRVPIGGVLGTRLPAWLQKLANQEMNNPSGTSALYIYPPAIPAGIGLYVGVDIHSWDSFNFGEDLVVTSPQCTGS